MIDSVLIAGVSAGIAALLRDAAGRPRWWLAFIIAEWAVVVAPMARTGRPPGARVVGAAVVGQTAFDVPGWSASVVRWAIAHSPTLAVGLVGLVALPTSWLFALWLGQMAGLVVIYAGVFTHPLAQGLHDRAAQTIVIDVRKR